MFNADQRDHMQGLASIPPEKRCPSGWHIIEREPCRCAESTFYGPHRTLAEVLAARATEDEAP